MPPELVRPPRRLLAATQEAVLSLVTGSRLAVEATPADELIIGDERASAEERLHVYEHMYRARLAEALESQFPRFARLMGDDGFAELAAAFVADEPSIRPSLRELGRPLPSWLAVRRPAVPALAALARLEWARADVFDLEDDPPLTLEALRGWPADGFGELPLRLVTAHRLLTVVPGAAALWDAIGTGDSTLPIEASGEGAESLIVWRADLTVYHRVLDADEHGALELAAEGTTFGVVCERLAGSQGPDAAIARAFSWLSTWVADGLIVAPAQLFES